MRALLTPRLLGAHLLVLVCTAAAVGLGVWQLNAWQARRDAEALDLTHATPVPLDSLMGPDDPFPGQKVGQPVTIAGTWLPEGTVYVSGREHDGQDGYWVVTPMTSGAADASAVPVVRGWVLDPSQAPAPPTGHAELTGWLQPSEGSGVVDEDPLDDVFPQLRVADLVQRVDGDLYSAYAVLDQEASGEVNAGGTGLAPADLAQLPDASTFTALRNLLYAIEWWFFGAFALFVWWRFVQDELAVEELDGAGAATGEPGAEPAVGPAEDSISTLDP